MIRYIYLRANIQQFIINIHKNTSIYNIILNTKGDLNQVFFRHPFIFHHFHTNLLVNQNRNHSLVLYFDRRSIPAHQRLDDSSICLENFKEDSIED